MIKTIHTDSAPRAIGPYSQAVVHNGIAYCSGQIAIDPETGELTGGDAGKQAERVMENLKAVLKEAGSDMASVLKCSIYIANMDDFATVNDVYSRYFSSVKPARETVAVKTLPKNVLIEISCIAAIQSV